VGKKRGRSKDSTSTATPDAEALDNQDATGSVHVDFWSAYLVADVAHTFSSPSFPELTPSSSVPLMHSSL